MLKPSAFSLVIRVDIFLDCSQGTRSSEPRATLLISFLGGMPV